MATAPSRVEFDGTVLGLAEEPSRLVVTESTAGVSSLPVLTHTSGMTPVVRVGRKESCDRGLYYPYGVAVDYHTGNIYVSDFNDDIVQVFDSNGEYLYKFGDEMNCPHSIAVSENRVFVTQLHSNCVSVHDLNGTRITQLGGIGECKLDSPVGIAISEINGDIYVCDSNNYRIQRFSKELPFESHFGHGIQKNPLDIKLTNEFIYVLCYAHPFLYCLTYDFIHIHNTAFSSISKYLKIPFSLFIDGSGHFIISDYMLDAIVIFNLQGKLMHTITGSVSAPFGVSLDSKGRILVADCSHSLLIF